LHTQLGSNKLILIIMACELTRGFTLDCNEGVGGVKDIYLANWNTFENGVVVTNGIVTTLPSANVYRYQPNRNTGALTITPTSNLENGTLYYMHVLEMTLGKLDVNKKLELEELSKAKVVAFVRLYDDNILMCGRTDGMFLTAGTYQSGKAKGDLNGYTLTLTGEEPLQPDFLQFDEDPFGQYGGIDVVVEPAP
jgi:hypothetical protein